MPKFKVTHCSSCGGEFGPGDHGFSHCESHAGMRNYDDDYDQCDVCGRRERPISALIKVPGTLSNVRSCGPNCTDRWERGELERAAREVGITRRQYEQARTAYNNVKAARFEAC